MATPRLSTRPLLRPGWRAVRYDDQHLQVGLDAPLRAVLPDSPDVRRLLTVLADPDATWEPPATLAAVRALERLGAADLLVPVPGSALESRLASAYGSSAQGRLAARRGARVAVDAPPGPAETVTALLRAEGLPPVTSAPAVVLVVSVGPLRRGRLDPLVQAGVPHLVVTGTPTGWEVGPFVAPGRTACLRCVDAARAETDPRRTMVADQLAGSGTVVPVPPVGQAAALALAVREVVAYVDGEVPPTWSASLLLGVSGAPQLRPWARHPLCGCAWDLVLAEE